MISFQPLNAIEEEWVNPDAPPHTYDIKEGLERLERGLPQEEIDRIHAEVQAEMERNDPSKQNYFMRLDTKSLIKTEAEYNYVMANGIPFKVVPFSHARQVLMEEDARKRNVKKAKQKKKTAKRSRRKNR